MTLFFLILLIVALSLFVWQSFRQTKWQKKPIIKPSLPLAAEPILTPAEPQILPEPIAPTASLPEGWQPTPAPVAPAPSKPPMLSPTPAVPIMPTILPDSEVEKLEPGPSPILLEPAEPGLQEKPQPAQPDQLEPPANLPIE